MAMSEVGFWCLLGQLLWVAVATFAVRAAYRNGVNDGYGFSREPKNPGYRKAGDYLTRYMYHRWPELRAK
jgi:hypothetical protein